MDLNGDGIVDILSGSYSGDDLPEMAGLFQVLYGKKDGTFSGPTPLKGTDGKFLIITPKVDGKRGDADVARIWTRPTAVDYDADGDLDLVVGNFEGTYYLFRGEGGGKFLPKSEKLMIEDKPLNTGHHSDPFFVDWDGDGDLDMLAGDYNGGVTLVENTAGPGKEMNLCKISELVPPSGGGRERWEGEDAKPSDSSRVAVEDLNGDGKLDLLVGDRVILKALNEGETQESTEKKLKEWEVKSAQLSKKMSKAKNDGEMAELRKKFQAQWEAREKIMKEEMTGFVWIYYQK